MKKLVAVAPLILLPLAALACGGDSPYAETDQIALDPEGGADIRGEIKELQTPGPELTLGAFLVEGSPENGARYARAWVRLKDTTVITRQQGSDIFPARVDDLQPGTSVAIKFEGVVAELDPIQATAGEILILE